MRAQRAGEIELIVFLTCRPRSFSSSDLVNFVNFKHLAMSKEIKAKYSFEETLKMEKSISEFKIEATQLQMKVTEFKGIHCIWLYCTVMAIYQFSS